MTPRASAKTKLIFGLVSCDVALYLTSSQPPAPRFDKAGPNGGELREKTYEAVEVVEAVGETDEPLSDPLPVGDSMEHSFTSSEPVWIEHGTGAEVTADEFRKGIHRVDGTFLDLTDGLKQIAEATKLDEMRITDFVRTEQIRRDRILGSYYLSPDGPDAPKVMALLHAAMNVERRCAVVKFTKRSRQSLGVIVPAARGVLEVIEVAWASDSREVPVHALAPSQVDVSQEELALAKELIAAMSSTRAEALDTQTDDARALTAELIARAEAKEMFVMPVRPEQKEGEVIELMRHGLEDREALKRAAA
jgi:non-homologous end joining protein Ku